MNDMASSSLIPKAGSLWITTTSMVLYDQLSPTTAFRPIVGAPKGTFILVLKSNFTDEYMNFILVLTCIKNEVTTGWVSADWWEKHCMSLSDC